MKFTIEKKDIQNFLPKILGITGGRTNLAITQTVLIQAEDTKIKITATDLKTSVEGFFPAEVETPGKIAINAIKLFEIVKEFPDSDILFNNIEKQWVEIGNNNVMYHIVGMDPDDYPKTPEIDKVNYSIIKSDELKTMLDRVLLIGFEKEEDRPFVLGVLIESIKDKNVLRMVSTDTNRLTKTDYIYEKDHSDMLVDIDENTIVSKEGLFQARKFIDKDVDIKFGFTPKHFVLNLDNETMLIKLFEGKMPDYSSLLGVEENQTVSLEKRPFIQMLKRMSIFSTEEYKSVVFKFTKNRLEIITTNPELGESKEDMEIEYDDIEQEITFNPKFFIDILNTIESDLILLSLSGYKGPCLIQGEKDLNYISLIMPMYYE